MRSLAVASMLALVVSACGSPTGIIVQVTKDSTVTETIDHLEFVVGVGEATPPPEFTRDATSSVGVDVPGRDLVKDPYELLLNDGLAKKGSKVTVAVIGFHGQQAVAFGGFDVPQPFLHGKVVARLITLHAAPLAQVTPNGCVTWTLPDQSTVTISSPTDKDCDGDVTSVDCNDLDPTIGPTQQEICGDGIDNNCNGTIDESIDGDGDGVSNCGGDCNDANPNTFPGAPELCDGEDNDCNGVCDDGALDKDHDRYNTCGEKIKTDGTCVDLGMPDCNDQNDKVHPEAPEICNGIDDDCSGGCDDDPSLDVDGDGFTICGTQFPLDSTLGRCGSPSSKLVDCDDGDGQVHPFADEVCDGKDDNCDGHGLVSAPCYGGDAGTGCREGTRLCDDDGSDGTFGFVDACVLGADSPFPPEYCAAYGACDGTAPEDPWTCANGTVSTTHYTCQLFTVGGTLCPGRSLGLMAAPVAVSCTWAIVGGVDQPHYGVGLFTGMGTGGQPMVSQCAGVSFDVVSAVDLIPQPQITFLRYFDDLNTMVQTTEIDLVPTPIISCPGTGGLHCMLGP